MTDAELLLAQGRQWIDILRAETEKPGVLRCVEALNSALGGEERGNGLAALMAVTAGILAESALPKIATAGFQMALGEVVLMLMQSPPPGRPH